MNGPTKNGLSKIDWHRHEGLLRFTGSLIFLLLTALAFLGLEYVFDSGGNVITITLGLLMFLPFSLGALAVFLSDPFAQRLDESDPLKTLILLLLALLIGGIVLREGIICMAILMPLWVTSGLIGAAAMKKYRRTTKDDHVVRCSILAILPMTVGLIGGNGFQATDYYEVRREITINASAETVWPLLLRMDDISSDEGNWNVSQNLLNIPRPIAAKVSEVGVGAKRYAEWASDVSFEEHIIDYEFQKKLRWNFVFPNHSVQHRTDRHISPDGQHLKIQEGGYKLVTVSPEKTHLILDTQYRVTTPMNRYSALWGELILGDIQANILAVIKGRAEVLS